MPSSNHVVVVQDLGSKYPAGKLVTSTSAKKVLPALADIYDHLGNPRKQISDNGPPFNSHAMDSFAEKRGIDLQKIPPLHPASNPAETFMRPLGKAMKIGHATNASESDTLKTLLNNYRNTPHPSTGIAPSAMLFWDGERSVFPRQSVSDQDVNDARERDRRLKESHQSKVNAGKYKIPDTFTIGDHVLVRNYDKTRKFDPIFMPDEYIITDIQLPGNSFTVERMRDGTCLKRHPDDLKKFERSVCTPGDTDRPRSEREKLMDYMSRLAQVVHDYEDSYEVTSDSPLHVAAATNVRPARERRPNSRYINDQFVNT